MLGEEKEKKALLNNDFKLSRLLEDSEFGKAGIWQIKKDWTISILQITIERAEEQIVNKLLDVNR